MSRQSLFLGLAAAILLLPCSVGPARGQDIFKRDARRRAIAIRKVLDHPRLSAETIRSGDGLNALLFAIETQLPDDALNGVPSERYALSRANVAHLNLREGPQGIVLRADTGKPSPAVAWPIGLRSDTYRPERTEFEATWNGALECAENGVFPTEVQAHLRRAMECLASQFERRNPRSVRVGSSAQFLEYRCCNKFLSTLNQQVDRLLEVNGMLAAESVRFTGETVPALVQHMTRHALEFAPARPEDEAAYRVVASGLADLYRAYVPPSDSYSSVGVTGVPAITEVS